MLNLEDAVNLARRAVNEKGADYVYPDSERRPTIAGGKQPVCRYMVDGKPSCIVGHIMVYIDHPVPEVREGCGATTVAADYFEPGAIEFLTDLQEFQDRGKPWGFALDMALDRN